MKNYLSFKRGLLTVFIVLISLATTLAVEVTVNFNTSIDEGIEGAIIQYRNYGGSPAWAYLGTTNIDGQVIGDIPSFPNTVYTKVRLTYNGKNVIKAQNIIIDPTFNFNTVPVTMKLLNSDGVEIASTNAQYDGNGWKQFGDGVTPETIELLATSYYFRVFVDGNFVIKGQDISVEPEVIFKTTKVTLHFSGNIKYLFSQWDDFAGPSMELLPNIYKFRFFDDGYAGSDVYINVGEDNIEKTAEYIRLTASTNFTVNGAPTQVRHLEWQAGGITTNGACVNLIDGNVSTVTTRLYYGGAFEDRVQDISINSFIDYNTVLVSMDLEDSQENPLASSNAEYYANGWQTFGDGETSESIEMLPQNYEFRVSYANGKETKLQDVSIDPSVHFKTNATTINFFNSNGDNLISDNIIYSNEDNNWMQFGSGNASETVELLSDDYTFRLLYAGAAIDNNMDLVNDSILNFSTVPVTVNIYGDYGIALTGTNILYESLGNFIPFGDGVAPETVELLPVSYNFKVTYNENDMTLNQNTALNPNVAFTVSAPPPALLSLDEDLLFDEEFMENNSTVFEAKEMKFSTVNAYPNPFSESITLSYVVETDAKVNISVYTMNGVLISTLVDGNMHKGNYEVQWNADDNGGSRVPNGTYIYRISIDNKVESNTMILQN